MHVGIANPRWREKRSRRMRNPQFHISGKRPLTLIFSSIQTLFSYSFSSSLSSSSFSTSSSSSSLSSLLYAYFSAIRLIIYELCITQALIAMSLWYPLYNALGPHNVYVLFYLALCCKMLHKWWMAVEKTRRIELFTCFYQLHTLIQNTHKPNLCLIKIYVYFSDHGPWYIYWGPHFLKTMHWYERLPMPD